MCMPICIYIYIHACVYDIHANNMCVCIHICICINIHIYIYIYVYTSLREVAHAHQRVAAVVPARRVARVDGQHQIVVLDI